MKVSMGFSKCVATTAMIERIARALGISIELKKIEHTNEIKR
jgi:hypothetical protein